MQATFFGHPPCIYNVWTKPSVDGQDTIFELTLSGWPRYNIWTKPSVDGQDFPTMFELTLSGWPRYNVWTKPSVDDQDTMFELNSQWMAKIQYYSIWTKPSVNGQDFPTMFELTFSGWLCGHNIHNTTQYVFPIYYII